MTTIRDRDDDGVGVSTIARSPSSRRWTGAQASSGDCRKRWKGSRLVARMKIDIDQFTR